MHYDTLQYITGRCNTIFIALHHKTLHDIQYIQYIAIPYKTLEYMTIHYRSLQYVAVHYSTLQYMTIHYNAFQYITMQYK